tara:strand:- start:1489 stop:2187 length:699 start_codon:yes stop_codon:yes gene_type:complete
MKSANSGALPESIMPDRPSPNFGKRADDVPIDMLVLHYTGMKDAELALDRLCDPTAEVSAHYCVDEDGTIFTLVDEKHRAWHAGVSYWRGETDINSRSIGVEIVNPGHEFGYRPFPEAQMAALIPLCQQILSRHPIPARNVVGHSDTAPDRKQDPGELFDWCRLASEGIGLWPEPANPGDQSLDSLLAAFGYNMRAGGYIAAFQRHFRPKAITGGQDAESLRIAAGLIDLIS